MNTTNKTGREQAHRTRSGAPSLMGATLLTLLTTLLMVGGAARAQRFVVNADHAGGIYQPGEAIHWQVKWEGPAPAPDKCRYVLKKGGLTVLKEDSLVLQDGQAGVDARFSEPGTLLLEVKAKTADGREIRSVGGGIAGWNQIQPSAPRPKDFDAFWKSKIAELKAIPENAQLEPADAGKPGVDYWKITLDNIHNTHIQGQLARPVGGGKFPALLIVQWAGVYGLSKSWVTDRAKEGWLTLNIEAHDLPIDRPEAFYKEQFAGPLQNYWAIGNESRDTSYFLRMYLGDYRAAQYLAERPDWDGRTLVVMGGSQGGQQTLVTAGLHPKITAALAEVPAGCDMLGPDAGRAPGWPMWYAQTQGKDAQKVHEASRYFDAVNFASRITCPILVGAGLIDEVCPPAGVAAAVNQIHAPKELVFFPHGGHQDENQSHAAYTQRCWQVWLPALRQGKPAPVQTPTAQKTAQAGSATPLKEAYKGAFLLGAALNYPALQGQTPLDVDLAATHFSALTPANSMKPDFLQRVEGRFTFAEGDQLVEIAEKSGAAPVGHVLVWHEQTPAWFFQGTEGQPVTRDLALTRMRKHIAMVVGHYKGRVKQWDVVNEALSDTPGESLRATPWLKAIGPDYIAHAFRAAHQADPDALLIYNDYNIELAYKRPKALTLLKSLIAQKIPINAVGIQCHWRLNAPDFGEVEEAIQQFAALGLKVMITELDIGVLPTRYQGADIARSEAMTPEQKAVMNPYTEGLPDAIAQQLAERYRQAFAMFLRHKDVIGRVTLWGVRDGDSWLNDFPVKGRTEYPLLFDREGKPKPAFFAVQRAPALQFGATAGVQALH